jgi:hypothetical protein
MSTLKILLAFLGVTMAYQSKGYCENKGFICVSYVLSKASQARGWKKKQFIQVGDGPKINFEHIPKIAVDDLELNKKMRIRVYWEDVVLRSWSHRFSRKRPGIEVFFRSGPGFRKKRMRRGAKCLDAQGKG